MFMQGSMLVSVPDPDVTPARMRVWCLKSEFLVVLSQHVRKTGNPIRALDLKVTPTRHALFSILYTAGRFAYCWLAHNAVHSATIVDTSTVLRRT